MESPNIDKNLKNKNIVIIILSIILVILIIALIFIAINKNNYIESQNQEIEKLNNEVRSLKHSLNEKNEAVAMRKISGNYAGEQKYQNYTSKYELLLKDDGTAEYCISATNIQCNKGTYVLDGKNITFTSKEVVKNDNKGQIETMELFKFTYNNDAITTQDVSNNLITMNKTESKLTMTEKYFK